MGAPDSSIVYFRKGRGSSEEPHTDQNGVFALKEGTVLELGVKRSLKVSKQRGRSGGDRGQLAIWVLALSLCSEPS